MIYGEINRPVLRYYGGKWKIADWIISNFPIHRVYVEPFGGMASVLIRKKPSSVEIYNDIEDDVVNLFRVLRDPKLKRQLIKDLQKTPYSRSESVSCLQQSHDPVERARRTVVLCSTTHNPGESLTGMKNGFRVSTKGDHRLPKDFINVARNLIKVSSRLKEVVIENKDAIELIQHHDQDDALFYCDPPYMGSTRSAKGNIYASEMKSVEQHLNLLKTLQDVKGMVVLSGYESELYNDQLSSWHKLSIRTVAGSAQNGGCFRNEVIWISPNAMKKMPQPTLFK